MSDEIDKIFSALVSNLETEEKLQKDQMKSDHASQELAKTPIEILLQDLMWRWLKTEDGMNLVTNALRNALHVILKDRTNPIVENLMHKEVKHSVSSIMTYYVNDESVQKFVQDYLNEKTMFQLQNLVKPENINEKMIDNAIKNAIQEQIQEKLKDSELKNIAENVVKSIMNSKFGL